MESGKTLVARSGILFFCKVCFFVKKDFFNNNGVFYLLISLFRCFFDFFGNFLNTDFEGY